MFGLIAGGAGAAASGAATAGMFASMFNPLTIGLGVAGFGLSLIQSIEANNQTKKRNEAAAKAANSQMSAINDNITSQRLLFYDNSATAGAQAQAAIATLQNSQGFTSGQSISESVAQAMSDTDVDQFARRKYLADFEKQQEYSKTSIAAQASAGMQSTGSPLMAGLQGGLQGFSLGSSLSSSIDAFQRTSAINEALTTLTPLASQGSDIALAQMQAIQSGVPPAQALMQNSPYVQPFLLQRQIQGLQLESARNTATSTGLSLGIIQNEAARLNTRYQNYGPNSGAYNLFGGNDPYLKSLRGY